MLKGFRDFIMRGNVVDLAVAVVIGAAFAKVVAAFTTGIITPLISAIGGKASFTEIGFNVGKSFISIGVVIDALIQFTIVAAVVYFLIVVPMNHIKERRASGDDEVAPDELELLTEIRDLLKARG